MQVLRFLDSARQFFSEVKQFLGQFHQFQTHLANQLRCMTDQLGQLQITNQVMATRSNVAEWRQCLQFAAQWHGVRLQSAYSLWQSSSLRAPPCPAEQQFKLEEGMPLSPLDQYLANKEVNSHMQLLMQYDYKLAVANENWQLIRANQSSMGQLDQQFLQEQAPVDSNRLQ